MKFKNIVENLLTEASKTDVLINKLGVNEYNAEALVKVVGPLAIFFAYKILEKYEKDAGYEVSKNIKERMGLVNGSNSFIRERDKLRSIMDWVRVALNGNIKAYQDLSFEEIYAESERWHESLGIGDSKIDYIENNEIVLDFRKDGIGYYWTNLGVSECRDEKDRMGHCGATRGILYSLRNYKNIENGHTLNKSLLTASIGRNGELLQLKGPKNSKPLEEYHTLIVPLFYLKDEDGYLIDSIGYEYASERDFKISDLTEEEVKKLYQDRPELFKGRQEYKLLRNIGLVEPLKYGIFTLTILPKYAEDYFRGDYSNIVGDVLAGDTWHFWDNSEYADWKYAVENELNDENISKIISLLKQKDPNISGSENLLELIEEYDEDDEIKNRIRWSVNDAEAQDYENYLYKNVKNAFEEYGDVISMNDEGVVISIDLETLISNNNISDEDMDEITERCGDDSDVECIFNELLGDGYIEKPRLDVDERWYPDADRNNFNEILNDRLNEI
jgi:hypothetical protein